MTSDQNILREKCKQLKWSENIDYKEIAIDLLGLKYHSFINWLHGYRELSNKRVKILEDYLNCML